MVYAAGSVLGVLPLRPRSRGSARRSSGMAFGGIGVNLRSATCARRGSRMRSSRKSGGAPRWLQSGDTIVAVDGTNLTGLEQRARASADPRTISTTAHITIVRAGAPLDTPLAIVRAAVTPPDVTARMLPNSVGYVSLRSFAQDAEYQSARRALALSEAQGEGVRLRSARQRRRIRKRGRARRRPSFQMDRSVANEGRDGKRRVSPADGNAVRRSYRWRCSSTATQRRGAELVAGAIQTATGTLVGTHIRQRRRADDVRPARRFGDQRDDGTVLHGRRPAHRPDRSRTRHGRRTARRFRTRRARAHDHQLDRARWHCSFRPEV